MTLRPRESFTSNDLSSCEWNEDEEEDTDYEGRTNRRLILPPPLSDEEILSIRRTFSRYILRGALQQGDIYYAVEVLVRNGHNLNRVNRKVDGYLDSDELQAFMKLRKSPISLWEAKMILQYADKTYHYYISLNQIIQLATLYGLGTRSPIRLNRDEFKKAMKQAFATNDINKVSPSSSSNLSDGISNDNFHEVEGSSNFKGIVDFFESKQQGMNNNSEDAFEKTGEFDDESPSVEESHESLPVVDETRSRDSDKVCRYSGSVKSMTSKWESAIKTNTSDGPYLLGEDYHSNYNSLVDQEREAAEKPYESECGHSESRAKSVKSIYRRRNESFDKMLFQEMLAEAKQHGLRVRSRRRSVSRDTQKSLKRKSKGRTAIRRNSKNNKSRPPTPPCPIIPDLPQEWL